MTSPMPALLLLAALSAGPRAGAAAAGNPYLAQARALYERLEPKACLQRLEQASRWNNSSAEELVEIEIVAGLCTFFLGSEQAAAERFELALRLSSDARLPPHTSPKIEELFEHVRLRRSRELKAAPPAPQQASNNSVPSEALPPSTAAAPIGKELESSRQAPAPVPVRRSLAGPIALGAAAVVAATAGIVLGVMANDFVGKADDAANRLDRGAYDKYSRDAKSYSRAANWCFGGAGATAVVGGTWLVLTF